MSGMFVLASDWFVSFTTDHSADELPVTIKVYKRLGHSMKYQYHECTGKRFRTADSAKGYAIEQGFLVPVPVV